MDGAGVQVPGRAGSSFAELFAEEANFSGGVREQAGDLSFERAGADDLPERGVCGEGQQVPGDVEGAGTESALVGLGLEAFGVRDTAAEQIENGGTGALVGREEVLNRAGVEAFRRCVAGESGKYQPDSRKFWYRVERSWPSQRDSSTRTMAARSERRSTAKAMWARSAMDR